MAGRSLNTMHKPMPTPTLTPDIRRRNQLMASLLTLPTEDALCCAAGMIFYAAAKLPPGSEGHAEAQRILGDIERLGKLTGRTNSTSPQRHD